MCVLRHQSLLSKGKDSTKHVSLAKSTEFDRMTAEKNQGSVRFICDTID